MIFDHIFIMSSKDVLKELQDKGFTNGIRRYHKGQGTESYLLPCGNAMIEFIWINEDDHVEHDVLNLFERELASRTGDGCPYGIAYRGEFDRNDDENILVYSPPYSPELLIGALKKNVGNIKQPLILSMNFLGRKNQEQHTVKNRLANYVTDPNGILLTKLTSIRFGTNLENEVPFILDPPQFLKWNNLCSLRNQNIAISVEGNKNIDIKINKNIRILITRSM